MFRCRRNPVIMMLLVPFVMVLFHPFTFKAAIGCVIFFADGNLCDGMSRHRVAHSALVVEALAMR